MESQATFNPEKRTAVVTGAAQGIGRRTAEMLAERGYRLALNDLRMPDETIRSIQSCGGEAVGHAGNVADESVIEELVRTVFKTWGNADVLVNNAGISLIAPAEKTSADDYGRVLQVSFVAPFFFFSSRRRHTRLQGDWSSDVCSSDLVRISQTTGSNSAERLLNSVAKWSAIRLRRAWSGIDLMMPATTS